MAVEWKLISSSRTRLTLYSAIMDFRMLVFKEFKCLALSFNLFIYQYINLQLSTYIYARIYLSIYLGTTLRRRMRPRRRWRPPTRTRRRRVQAKPASRPRQMQPRKVIKRSTKKGNQEIISTSLYQVPFRGVY